MKRFSVFAAALFLAACAKEPTLSSDALNLSVSDFPGYTILRTVGTPDEGKTAWEESDALYLILQTPSDSLEGRYRIEYTGGGWNIIKKYENGNYTSATTIPYPSESYRAEVYYAPSYEFSEGSKLSLKDGLTPGLDEFLAWSSGEDFSLGGSSTLGVNFTRDYSRLRVSANALYSVKLACADFIPAGLNTSALGGYTLTAGADENANAFFFGSWSQGADISLMSYDTDGGIAAEHKYEGLDASVDGEGYAEYCVASSGEDDNPGGSSEEGEIVDDEDADDFVTESEFTKVITVAYSGSGVSVSPENILSVKTSGAHVTLGDTTSSAKNVRILVSGTSSDGSLKIYNQKKMLLSLDGASITSSCGPAINCQCGKRLYVTLSGSSSLSDASTYTDTTEGEDSKACLFSEGQIIFSGEGSLSVKGNCKHAIASDDYVRVLGGTITVTGAASDAIKVNDYYRQDAGTVTLNSTGDAVQCDNDHIRLTGGKLTANTSGAKGSGLQATGDIIISGGEFNSTVTGNGSKCIKTDSNLEISAGTVTLKTTGAAFYDSEDKDVSSPACIRAENTCTLSGGTISCTSTGKAGKGINAYIFKCNDGASLTVSTSGSSFYYNGDYSYAKGIKGSNSVEINGGTINVTTTGSGAEGIESKGNMTINGGQIYIKAYDDAINSAGQIVFNGGYTFAYATNNDAIDSNYGKSGSIMFKGGVVIAHGAKSPEEGIDADNDSRLTFSGGTVFCSGGKQSGGGGSGSSTSPSCTQSTILLGGTSLSTGYFTITDSSSNVLFSCYVPRSMSENYSFVSSPLLKSGTTYKYGVTSSKPTSPTSNWGTWFYEGGTSSVSAGSFTATGSYQSLSSGGSGGGGGRRPW